MLHRSTDTTSKPESSEGNRNASSMQVNGPSLLSLNRPSSVRIISLDGQILVQVRPRSSPASQHSTERKAELLSILEAALEICNQEESFSN